VGVVTSPDGAAVRDILRTIKRRNSAIRVLIAPARVQGDGAAREIIRAINLLNSHHEVDVIIIGRGGGSIEDLWCFNEEAVARAICGSRTPVISAVGHETDFTIADFVADIRASTPSAAAEIVAKARDEVSARIHALSDRLSKTVRYRILEARSRLFELQTSRAERRIAARLRATSQRLDDAVYTMTSAVEKMIRTRRMELEALTGRLREKDVRHVLSMRRSRLGFLTSKLRSSLTSSLRDGRERLSVAAGKLDSISPLAVLARGYAIAFDAEGRVIKRADTVASGEQVRVKVAEGEMDCIKK
jgi:exodeoxyribonuclease VII large subunit